MCSVQWQPKEEGHLLPGETGAGEVAERLAGAGGGTECWGDNTSSNNLFE